MWKASIFASLGSDNVNYQNYAETNAFETFFKNYSSWLYMVQLLEAIFTFGNLDGSAILSFNS